MKTGRHIKPGASIGKGVAITVLLALGLILLGATVITQMIVTEKAEITDAAAWCAALVAVAVLVGCLAGMKVSDDRWILVVCGGATAILLVMLSLNALLFDGTYPKFLLGFSMVALGAIGSICVKLARNKKGKKRRYKHAYR